MKIKDIEGFPEPIKMPLHKSGYSVELYPADEIENIEIELDVEKVKRFFDNRLVRVFDQKDAEYKNARLTGQEAHDIAKTIAKACPIKVKGEK